LTGNATLKHLAKSWTLEVEPVKFIISNHDIGFQTFCPMGWGLRLAPEEVGFYRDILIDAARSLCSRYNKAARTIRSWGGSGSTEVTVIIDNMMNLELIMYAANVTDDPEEAKEFRDIAVTHAETCMKHHFRDDASSFHVVNYDGITGEVVSRGTAQGFCDSSAWSRGQSWGLYGFMKMYKWSGDEKFLKGSTEIANFWLTHPRLPADGIPYWDFNAGQPGYNRTWPLLPDRYPYDPSVFPISDYRDSSAGAIATSAFFHLYEFTKNITFLAAGIDGLRSLGSKDYWGEPGKNGHFVLRHTVGSFPSGRGVDVAVNYADYYFYEALGLYRNFLEAEKRKREGL
jgi:chondroitin AC lyase